MRLPSNNFGHVSRFVRRRQSKPVKDATENMQNARVSYNNGRVELRFERAADTADDNDWSLADTECYYFIFPVGGGQHSDTDFTKHLNTPAISAQKMCIGKAHLHSTELADRETVGDSWRLSGIPQILLSCVFNIFETIVGLYNL